MKNIFYGIFLFISLYACKQKVETEYVEIPAIHASNLYHGDSVYLYIQKHHDTNKDIAKSYLQRSEEVVGNDLPMAVYYTKRAITLHPTFENYKKLASLLEKSNNYKELNSLYYFLVQPSYIKNENGQSSTIYIFEKPDEDLFYESVISEIVESGYIHGWTIHRAREFGFDIAKLKQKIFTDKRLKLDMTTPESKDMMLLFLSPDELAKYNKLESTFKEFLSSIKNVSPVFDINKENIYHFMYDNFNGMNDYYEDEETEAKSIRMSNIEMNYLVEKKENPDHWYKYNYNHLIDINDSIKAVIYAIDSSEIACPIDMRHIYHRLVIYNQKSEIISSKIIALQSGEHLMTASFNINKFSVVESKRNWKKTYDKKDFDNYVVDITKKNESSYEILPDGKIIEVKTVISSQL